MSDQQFVEMTIQHHKRGMQMAQIAETNGTMPRDRCSCSASRPQQAGTGLAATTGTPMVRHATGAILLVGFLLQPLSPALCVDECKSHRSRQPFEVPVRLCMKSPHTGSNCRHSPGALCAVLQTRFPGLSAPPIVLLAVLPAQPSALLEAPARHTGGSARAKVRRVARPR